jgi:hypothetical protein
MEVVAEIRERGVGGVWLDVYHDVETPVIETERATPATVDFPRPAFEAITDIRFPEFLRRGDADARVRHVIRGVEDDRVSGKELLARFVHSKKIAPFRDSLFLWQPFRTGRSVCRAVHCLLLRLDGEALAPFAAAARENRLTVLGTHPDEEAVSPLPAAVVRLKRSLHCLTL